MIEISAISGVLGILKLLASPALWLWSKIPKRKPNQVYDREGFLQLVNDDNPRAVRVVDSSERAFEWTAFVREIIFDSRSQKHNQLGFYFTPDDEADISSHFRDMGFFGPKLREKAKMLQKGDKIKMNGFFVVYPHAHNIRITSIERLDSDHPHETPRP